jgi:ABC-type Zn uptake system ZnuABC Zn-binding protein ZnuA
MITNKGFLFIVLFFLLVCQRISSQTTSKEPIKLLTSATIFADMIKNIGGDLVSVKSIVPIGGDPHIYEAVPNDINKINEAEIIFVNGLNFENWIYKIIKNSGPKSKVIILTSGIDPITSAEHNDSKDPHAWMDVVHARTYARNIYEGLATFYPNYKNDFYKNYKIYDEKLIKLNEYIINQIATIPKDQRMLITTHDAFSYYGKRYGLIVNAMMGISTEAQAQTQDMKRITQAISQFNIPAIFVESTINPKLFEQISKDKKVSIGGSLFADSLGDSLTKASTYIEMLTFNTDMIVKGLTSNQASEKSNVGKEIQLFVFILLLMIASWVLFYFKVEK